MLLSIIEKITQKIMATVSSLIKELTKRLSSIENVNKSTKSLKNGDIKKERLHSVVY